VCIQAEREGREMHAAAHVGRARKAWRNSEEEGREMKCVDFVLGGMKKEKEERARILV
jgi:hypothetical protein